MSRKITVYANVPDDGETTFDQSGGSCDRLDSLVRKYVDKSDVHHNMKVMVITQDDDVLSVEVSPRCASSRVTRADHVETKRTTQMSA